MDRASRTRRYQVSVMAVLLSSMTSLASPASTASVEAVGVWLITPVDEGNGALAGSSVSTSIALDSQGWAHICYAPEFVVWNGSEGTVTEDIRLASDANDTWNISTVDTPYFWWGAVTGSTDIAIDSLDRIHVTYVIADGVNYSYLGPGGWVTEQIPDTGLYDAGGVAVLAIDSDGSPRIFFGGQELGIRETIRVSGSWQIAVIVDAYVGSMDVVFDQYDNYYLTCAQEDVWGAPFQIYYYSAEYSCSFGNGSQSAIAVDAWGDVHLVYSEEGNETEPGRLMYVLIEDGTDPQPAQQIGEGEISDPSMVADQAGRVHLVYSLLTNVTGSLVYSVKNGDIWESSTVVQVQNETEWAFVQSPSIALDMDGTPHVSYWVGSAPFGIEGGLFLATLSTGTGNVPEFSSPWVLAVTILFASVLSIALSRRRA